MSRISLVEQYDNKDVIQQIYKLKDDQGKLEERQRSVEGSLDSAVTKADQALTESGQARTDAGNAVASAVVETTASTAKLKLTKNNRSQAETDIPLASGVQAGMMGASTYNGLVQLGDRVSALENKQNVYYVTFSSSSPSQSEITTAFTTASGRAPRTGDYCTDIGKNLTYGYDGTQWIEVTGSNVPAFTNEVGGIIKGDASTPGKVFAEADGTGSVNGWDALNQQVQGKQDDLTAQIITLTSTAWSDKSQTVDVTGVTASSLVFVSPSPASFDVYGSSGVRATAQADGTLTFTCSKVPATDVSVQVVIA